MKIIITENQINLLDLEKKSDILYKLLYSFYPENYESYSESSDQTEVFDSEDEGNLLFYYDWERKEFYVGANFIDDLFNSTSLPFLNVHNLINKDKSSRDSFNNLIKVFAKRHYGLDVNSVWFHWY